MALLLGYLVPAALALRVLRLALALRPVALGGAVPRRLPLPKLAELLQLGGGRRRRCGLARQHRPCRVACLLRVTSRTLPIRPEIDSAAARLEVGQWQALADVPGVGRRWVHEMCALDLGVSAHAPDPKAQHPDARRPAAASSTPMLGPVRIVVIGSECWPRERAVEVRDAIAAVARGHRDVVIVHGARRDRRGPLRGVEAWAELTAQRLGLVAEAHDRAPSTVDELHTLRPTVVVAFPLQRDDPVEVLIAALELAGVPVLAHRDQSGSSYPEGQAAS